MSERECMAEFMGYGLDSLKKVTRLHYRYAPHQHLRGGVTECHRVCDSCRRHGCARDIDQFVNQHSHNACHLGSLLEPFGATAVYDFLIFSIVVIAAFGDALVVGNDVARISHCPRIVDHWKLR